MASVTKLLGLSKEISGLCGRLMGVHLKSITSAPLRKPAVGSWATTITNRTIQTTAVRSDLMQFFDEKKHWGQMEVKSGRAWTADELRIKSNSDLHKLWYVLLIEKNMLLTMEQECKEKVETFPSPERLDKVQLSMDNLELVVRERNKAYHLLETGVDGERPGKMVNNQLGMRFFYREREHLIPKVFNAKWRARHVFAYEGAGVTKFRRLLKEKLYNVRRKSQNRDRNEVMHLLRRNPNLSQDLLARRYPTVDIAKLIREDKIRGHNPV